MSLEQANTKKVDLIQQHPLFSSLSPLECETLAAQFSIEKVEMNAVIVKEGELVDSIYFIIDGIAEVRHPAPDQPNGSIPVAILNPGEAIGLSQTGLFSQTGTRTATVIALTEMHVLKLGIAQFDEFIARNKYLDALMQANVHTVLSMNLIKQSAPFAKLSMENLRWLAEQVKTKTYSAGKRIFQQGKMGKNCYLLCKGKVEIYSSDKKEKKSLAVLEPYSVFGEVALLMDLPRNASAVALDDCEVMMISRESLLKVVKTETDTANSLMTVVKSRARPLQFSYIEIHQIKTDDQQTNIILKDPQNWNYYQLSNEEYFIWKLSDGNHSLHDIAIAFHKEFNIFEPGMIANLIIDLAENGFIKPIVPEWKAEAGEQSIWLKTVIWIKKIFEASVSFGDTDQWITKTYNGGVYLLYTKPAQIILFILSMIGLIVFILGFNHHLALIQSAHHTGWIILIATFMSMVMTIIHELAHAYTTKFFGRGVACFGVGWFWLGPVAFCDTSDMWLGNKKQRLAVDMAGLYSDFILAGIASLIIPFVENTFTINLLYTFSLFFYLGIFYNLSPNIELDGYYILMDLIGKDNLRESAIEWLAKPTFTKAYKAEIMYWFICLIYLILEAVIPYFVMKYLLSGLFGVSNPYLSMIVPVIAITLSSLGIWGEIKQKKSAATLQNA